MEVLRAYKTDSNVGKRILAGLTDYMIICVFMIVLILTLGEQNIEGVYEITGLPALIPIVFWGIMTIGFEQIFGRTLGNFAVDLKPISINGLQNELTLAQSIRRHLLDPLDMFFFGLIGYVCIKNTGNNQRLGDLWAKTIVINCKKD